MVAHIINHCSVYHHHQECHGLRTYVSVSISTVHTPYSTFVECRLPCMIVEIMKLLNTD